MSSPPELQQLALNFLATFLVVVMLSSPSHLGVLDVVDFMGQYCDFTCLHHRRSQDFVCGGALFYQKADDLF